jgi:hypothetical protein
MCGLSSARDVCFGLKKRGLLYRVGGYSIYTAFHLQLVRQLEQNQKRISPGPAHNVGSLPHLDCGDQFQVGPWLADGFIAMRRVPMLYLWKLSTAYGVPSYWIGRASISPPNVIISITVWGIWLHRHRRKVTTTRSHWRTSRVLHGETLPLFLVR